MGLRPFQTWVTRSNSACHQMLEVITIGRAFDSQWEMC